MASMTNPDPMPIFTTAMPNKTIPIDNFRRSIPNGQTAMPNQVHNVS